MASRTAAANAAEAEGVLARLQSLHERASTIVRTCEVRSAGHGASLDQAFRFRMGMAQLVARTEDDIARARQTADDQQRQRQEAERSREVVADRLEECRKALSQGQAHAPAAARRTNWHDT